MIDALRSFIETLVSTGHLPKSKRNDPDVILRAIDAFRDGIFEAERKDEFEREEAEIRLKQAAAIDPLWSYRYH